MTNLKHLYLSSNGLTDLTCQELSSSRLMPLKSLGLGCNRLGDQGAKLISEFLKSPDCQLQLLEIASCGIGQKGAYYISQALGINTSLVYLDMGYLRSTTDLGELPNDMGSMGAIALAQALSVNKTLR